MYQERDPNYRDASVYEYGEVRDITLHAIVNTSILWDYTYTKSGYTLHCGGFPGPFEALAACLERVKLLNKATCHVEGCTEPVVETSIVKDAPYVCKRHNEQEWKQYYRNTREGGYMSGSGMVRLGIPPDVTWTSTPDRDEE